MKRYGTDPHKLVRETDPATSNIAAHSVDSKTWEQKVYQAIRDHGPEGAIQDQIIDTINTRYGHIPYSTITARFKALEEKGYIKYRSSTRKGHSGKPSRIRVAACFIGQQELFEERQ